MKFIETMRANGKTPTCTAVADLIINDLKIPKSFRWERELDRKRAVLFAHDGARALAGSAIRATANHPKPEDADQLILDYRIQTVYVVKDDNGDEIVIWTKDEIVSEYKDRRLRRKVAELRATGKGTLENADRLERYLDHLFPRHSLVAA